MSKLLLLFTRPRFGVYSINIFDEYTALHSLTDSLHVPVDFFKTNFFQMSKGSLRTRGYGAMDLVSKTESASGGWRC